MLPQGLSASRTSPEHRSVVFASRDWHVVASQLRAKEIVISPVDSDPLPTLLLACWNESYL